MSGSPVEISPENLDSIFRPIETDNEVSVNEKIEADRKLQQTINSPELLNSLDFEQASNGFFYPVIKKEDAQFFADALSDFARDGLAKDMLFKQAVSFDGAKVDSKSTFKGRIFFIGEEPIQDAAKGVSVNFAKTFTQKVAASFPATSMDKLNGFYKYFRDYIYRNMFLIGNINSPEGWHVFSQNGFRIEFKPFPNISADAAGLEKGKFVLRYSYNLSITGDQGPGSDKMFTVGMGHNHIVLHQTVMIDDPSDNGGGDFFAQYMATDPDEPEDGERRLPAHNHEIIPSTAVNVFDLS